MSDIAISVENVSKMYRLGNYGTNTLGDDITRWWANVRGKEDPFSKIAETNDRSTKADSDYVWSLKDVSFEVKQGQTVGIIGKNGAGKSTLLKILSRITAPTSGNIRVNGRMSSLLEVGTGFNPELTGRENAYMNGAILGMNRKEVASKLDQIIDFSGVEGYIDTPVKRYSSGMYVRLAFAVAAHLNTEILILDEVLSVGDVEFQKKCLDKMEQICYKEGKTIVFVSHAMNTIERMCSEIFYLKNGEMHMQGKTQDILPLYMRDQYAREKVEIEEEIEEDKEEEIVEEKVEILRAGNGKVLVEELVFLNQEGKNTTTFNSGESITIKAKYKAINYEGTNIKSLVLGLPIFNAQDLFVTALNNKMAFKEFKEMPLEGEISVFIDKLPLMYGSYYIKVNLQIDHELSDMHVKKTEFYVQENDFYGSGYANVFGRQGVYINQVWKY
jgi:lipopolysaccharide transport system ATP-binding protein